MLARNLDTRTARLYFNSDTFVPCILMFDRRARILPATLTEIARLLESSVHV